MPVLANDFVETVKRSLARHHVPAKRLEIEVTETVLFDRSIAGTGQTLEALRAMGCTLAMDDFGTGYASLSHLTSSWLTASRSIAVSPAPAPAPAPARLSGRPWLHCRARLSVRAPDAG
ncbi:EAL domain-containing protein [Sandarakinorhabdus sp.]|jgi:hypothetical protein|uniref:EAL domain-containing protein n=1 Tax=Sandarakinorhabdus sp. TaxID=1916663 RepID=UPI00356193F4